MGFSSKKELIKCILNKNHIKDVSTAMLMSEPNTEVRCSAVDLFVDFFNAEVEKIYKDKLTDSQIKVTSVISLEGKYSFKEATEDIDDLLNKSLNIEFRYKNAIFVAKDWQNSSQDGEVLADIFTSKNEQDDGITEKLVESVIRAL